jgi:hypothetical protein
MKKFLLICFLLGTAFTGWSQIKLDEFYTTGPQWFELHNTSQTASAPLACYTMVTYSAAVTNGPKSGQHNAGIYTLTFPSTTAALAPNQYFLAAATNQITYSGSNNQTQNFTADKNWNTVGVKRYDLDNAGTSYGAAQNAGTLGTSTQQNATDKFLSTQEYGYFLFDNNGNYVSGFVGNNQTNIPSWITKVTSVSVSSGGCTVSLNMSTVTAAKTGFLPSATGNDNGYSDQGECGSWDKTSTNPSVSPQMPNPPKVDKNGNYNGTLTTTASFYCNTLRYTISGGTAPYTIEVWDDVDNDNLISVVDTKKTTITNATSPGTISVTSGVATRLIMLYRDATGCIGAVNAPTTANGTLQPTGTISCNETVTFTMNGTSDASGAVDYSFLFSITAKLYFGTSATPVSTLTGISSFTTPYTMPDYIVPKDASNPRLEFTTSAGCTSFDLTGNYAVALTPSAFNIVVGGRLGTIDAGSGKMEAFYWLNPTLTGATAYPLRVTMYEDANNDGRVNNGETEVAHHDYSSGDAAEFPGLLNNTESDIIVVGASTNTNASNCPPTTYYTAAQQAPLPVHFKSFTAKRKDENKVALTWVTANEQNNRGFQVQRNTGGEWKDIAFVFSQADGGNSSAELSYSYTDVNPSKGVSQYRILQVDLDGKGRYSETRAVHGTAASGKLLLFPNPSHTGAVTLVFATEGAKNILVYDISGRTVQEYKNIAGSSLEVKNLVSGVYTVQVRDGVTSTVTTEKFIITKR